MADQGYLLTDLRAGVGRRQKDLTPDEAKRAIAGVLETITETLAEGGRVELRDFDVFLRTRQLSAGIGRNLSTGEVVALPDRRSVGFRMARDLQRRLNANR